MELTEIRKINLSGKQVATVLQSIFPERSFENLSILSVYKSFLWKLRGKKFKGREMYDFEDLIATCALFLCAENGIDVKYFAEILRHKKKKSGGK